MENEIVEIEIAIDIDDAKIVVEILGEAGKRRGRPANLAATRVANTIQEALDEIEPENIRLAAELLIMSKQKRFDKQDAERLRQASELLREADNPIF